MSAASQRWAHIAGLAVGAASWALSTQASEVIAFLDCDRQRAILTPLDLGLIAVSVACAIASLFAAPRAGDEWLDFRGGRVRPMLGFISFGAGLLFAAAIASQLAAALIVERCSR